VVKASQTISFGPLADGTYGAPDFTVSATASSGLPVTFAATGSCTVTVALVHVTGAGTCTITASQDGDSHYNAATPVAQSFSIAKADQTISFAAIGDQVFGAADFGIAATATSGLPVSLAATGPCSLSSPVSPAQVHISGAGTCTITASQPGDGNYNPAPDVPRSFSISASNQTITFAPLPDRTFGDADFTVTATASSGLAVSFTAAGSCTVAGSTVHITGAGSCTITASQAGNANFNPAPDVSRTFAIAKEKTTTTYTGTTGNVLYGSTVALSGVLKTIGGSPISGKTLTLTLGSGAGAQTCTGTTNASGSASCSVTVLQAVGSQPVSASFAGDANYLASSGSGTVSVFTAMSLSQSALAQATALLAGARHSDQDRLKDVVRELTAALAPSLWDDGNHVDSRRGNQVFDKHRDAVDTLMDLQRHGSLSDSALQGIIDTVVHADRVLAEVAVADAIAAGGDRRMIADAQEQLARAARDVARGRFDSAIGHYEKAWEDALDALKQHHH
jgi:hypothetical protein